MSAPATAQFLTGNDAESVRDLVEHMLRDAWPDRHGEVTGSLTAASGARLCATAHPTFGGTGIEVHTPGGRRVVAHAPGWRPADGPDIPPLPGAAIVPDVALDTPSAAPIRALLAGWHCVGDVPPDRYPDLTAMVAAFGDIEPEHHGDMATYRRGDDELHVYHSSGAAGSDILLLAGWIGFVLDAPFWRGTGTGRHRKGLHPARVAGATWWVHPGRWAAEQEQTEGLH